MSLPAEYYNADGSRKSYEQRAAERKRQQHARAQADRESREATFDPFSATPEQVRQHYEARAAERRARERAVHDVEHRRREAVAADRFQAAVANPYAERLRLADERGEKLPERRRKELKRLAKQRADQIKAEVAAAEKQREMMSSERYQLATRNMESLRKLAEMHGDESTPEQIGRLAGYLDAFDPDAYWREQPEICNALLRRMNESLHVQRTDFVDAGNRLHESEQSVAEVVAELEQEPSE